MTKRDSVGISRGWKGSVMKRRMLRARKEAVVMQHVRTGGHEENVHRGRGDHFRGKKECKKKKSDLCTLFTEKLGKETSGEESNYRGRSTFDPIAGTAVFLARINESRNAWSKRYRRLRYAAAIVNAGIRIINSMSSRTVYRHR